MLKRTCERDLSLMLERDEWVKICKNIKMLSRDARVYLIQFKIMHRLYWTPPRLFRLGLTECKYKEGHLLHALWSCEKVQEFWTWIHSFLSESSKNQTEFWPRLFVIGDNSVLTEGIYIKSWIKTSIMIGRQMLLRGWKFEGVPSVQ